MGRGGGGWGGEGGWNWEREEAAFLQLKGKSATNIWKSHFDNVCRRNIARNTNRWWNPCIRLSCRWRERERGGESIVICNNKWKLKFRKFQIILFHTALVLGPPRGWKDENFPGSQLFFAKTFQVKERVSLVWDDSRQMRVNKFSTQDFKSYCNEARYCSKVFY